MGLPHIYRRINNKWLKILIDTGATSCYTSPKIFSDKKTLDINKRVKTVNGFTIIKYYYEIYIFDRVVRFYEIENLEADCLIGYNLLRNANINLNLERNLLIYNNKAERMFMDGEPLPWESNITQTGNKIKVTLESSSTTDSRSIYSLEPRLNNQVIEKVPSDQNVDILNKQVRSVIGKIHSKINITLPFRTDVVAEIKTNIESPIWTKQYPYPLSASEFINKEISKLLKDNIIRPSKSPYSSPVWVVPKKGFNEDGTPKSRLVIDFKKLNEHTISDKYPIPDTNVILSNLGKSKYFSTIDLESGFHQILMKESDIQKTSFSVNNGKYEYIRLPFGLKNAPSIFQRAMDDILKPYIGKFCHVYIDDIIVFSKNIEEHTQHLNEIIKILKEANMKISLEKSKFYQTEVEYLGYVISENIITTDPKKITTIKEYPEPETLRQLRSFLGMTGYYRKFIQNYAQITKPLTIHLNGENGKISKKQSKKCNINIGNEGRKAFNKLKEYLVENVKLTQPDFKKKFILTTDASNDAIGGVLSQDDKPIIFISKTLNKTEKNYATNEKELFAIVYALKNLRNYLYGVADLEIHTDHQPLTYSVSKRNPNIKMKRWHAIIEEYAPKIIYKPGKDNIVADALSRQNLNIITNSSQTIHSAESSDNIQIETTSLPVNCFKQQIILNKGNISSENIETCFNKLKRYTITYTNTDQVITLFKKYIVPGTVCIYASDEDLYEVKSKLLETFSNKFLRSKIYAQDIPNKEDQLNIITDTHKRAHRGTLENYNQIKTIYYWPNMKKQISSYTNTCVVCNENKYDRKPIKFPIGAKPIPEKEGEQLHIDIFYASKEIYLTVVDSYSKFLVVHPLESKIGIELELLKILNIFPYAKNVICDNESVFKSVFFKNTLERKKIEIYFVPVSHSTTNGQVERTHSTLIEITRCIKAEYNIIDDKQAVLEAAHKYNETVHSVTGLKPQEVLFNKVNHNLREILKEKQLKMLNTHNENRESREFKKNEIVYVKNHGTERNKLKKRFNRTKVLDDKKDQILTNKGKIHKDNIKS